MADKRLIFPLGFDLDGAVKDAADDWKKIYAKKLEKAIQKTPIKVKLEFDSKGLDLKALRDYTKLTKEAAKAAKDAADIEAKRALARKRNADADVAEQTREARIAKTKAQAEMAELRLNDAKENGVRHTRELNAEYKKQGSYVQRLIQRMGIYFSIYQFAGMLKNIRETTAEFELQEVALGAIIQDAHEAAVLFSQIKAAAVESPYQIKELVNYTKQLAAYGFEQETLFDTTMKLADVSAGLGADMSRIILAYGQISAASVLKGTELRQLTELGIPMVELLAEKFTQLRGEMVSTGEIFEMISDKAVSFKMVEEIFKDLTSEGGMFYDMQKKQADTLAGQWSNLKDSIAIAYDEIGNTEAVRGVMEGWISAVKMLVEEWHLIANVIKGFAVQMLIAKGVSAFLPIQVVNTKMLTLATNNLTAATARYNAVQGKGMAGQSAKWAMNHAKWMIKAANATTLFGRSMKRLAAFFAGGGWVTLAIAAVSALVAWFISARKEAKRLNEELAKIGSEGATKMDEATRNFERLAKIAVRSVDGTKDQTDALKELQRTYGDIIPAQELTIEKLREMNGEYKALTDAIREKIAMQTLEQKIGTIQEDYSSDIERQRDKLIQYLQDAKQLSKSEAGKIVSNLEKQIKDGTYAGWSEALKKAAKEELLQDVNFGYISEDSLYDFISLVSERESAIKRETDALKNQNNTLQKYQGWWDETAVAINKAIGKITESRNTKLYEEAEEKARVKEYANFLRRVFAHEKIDVSSYITDDGIDFKALWSPDVTNYISVQAENAVRKVQDALQGLDGWKETIQNFSKDVTIDGITSKRFLYTDEEIQNMSSLETTLEDVAKKWKENNESVERYAKTLKGKVNPEEKKQIENKKAIAEELRRQAYAVLEYYNSLDLIAEKGTGGGEQDPWIVLMKNRAAFMKDFQKGVEDLGKKMQDQDALLKQQGIMRERGVSLGYDVGSLTGSSDELVQWYEESIKEVANKIRGLGAKEGFSELTVNAILGKDTKNLMIKSYQELLQWLFNQKTDFETKQLEENLKKEIDRLATAVSRSKEAKDFYDKMLDMTGDKQLSADLTMSVYGGVGDDLQKNIKEQLEKAFSDVDISSAFDGDNVDYKKLEALIPQLPEDLQANARKLVNEGIKDNARWLQDLYKTYEEFKTYEERRTTVMDREAQKRREIEANAFLSPEQKESRIKASRKREAQELDTIDLEEFKASEDWIQTFENSDKVGTKSIEHLMVALKEFIEVNKDLTPEQIKTLMTEYDKLYQGLIARNPLKAITEGTKEYFVALKDIRGAKKEQKTAEDEVEVAKQDVVVAKSDLSLATTDNERAAATERLAQAEERLTKAENKRAKAEGKVRKTQDKQRSALNKVRNGVNESANAYNALGEVINGVMETFNVDETSKLGVALKSVSQALTMVAGVLGIINAMITLIESHPIVLAISAGIMAIIGAIMLFKNLKTADAEAKIEEMTKRLEELEHAYERLEKAQEKALGADYITNYNQRLKNLVAQQRAYLAQAEAERSKGKEADQGAIKDYEESARDAADSIIDMQNELSEHFLGTDVTSAARDFAQAWIDAYKEFGSTTDAMNNKFSEMIENMVVESLAAKVIQGHLEEIFEAVDALSKDGQISVSDAAHIAQMSKLAAENIDIGMTNLMSALELAGLSVRGMGSDLTGISKDIATASEESILGLAAGINTQNFYISQVPPKLDTIIAILQGGGSPVGGGINVQDLITIQNQHLAYLPNIATNTLNTADRCERAAVACESALSKISSVISVRGATSTHIVNVN